MQSTRRSVIGRLAVANVSRVLIWLYCGLLFWAVVPLALGNHTTVVMSGSMEPSIGTGDLVVVAPINGAAVRAGQVAQFDDPDHPGRLRLHRVKYVEDGVFTTQGDANDVEDPSTITAEAIHGIGILRVPWIGLPLQQLEMGSPWLLVMNVLLLLACWAGTRADRALLEGSPPEGDDTRPDARDDSETEADREPAEDVSDDTPPLGTEVFTADRWPLASDADEVRR